MIIQHYIYELQRELLKSEDFYLLDNDTNWIFIDKSHRDKIIIKSGKMIDDILVEKGIPYYFRGITEMTKREYERKVPVKLQIKV